MVINASISGTPSSLRKVHRTMALRNLLHDGNCSRKSLAKKLGISADNGKGYRALANISEHGGQEVPHFHFHLFGGERVGKMVE